jgi:iron uptake system component EfeO
MNLSPALSLALAMTFLPACDEAADAQPNLEADAILATKAFVTTELGALHNAALAIQAALPPADADGWNPTADAEAVAKMRAAWKTARASYERVEGAIAVIFPDIDAATDERYDGFIEAAADDNLFDGDGVTGIHAIERILWADAHPAHVVTFEAALPNYIPAAFPSTAAEATDFRDGLAQRLIDDTAKLKADFAPLALDAPAAFRGVIGSIEEQLEKVALAATGEDESRYAQHTLADMRANLEGGRRTFEAFKPLIANTEGGNTINADIEAGFARISAAYAHNTGDAIPEVPEGFDPDAPSADDLASAYGQLFTVLSTESDPEDPSSTVSKMLEAADALGIPQL